MKVIKTKFHPVFLGENLEEIVINQLKSYNRIVIISDSNVYPLHGKRLFKALKKTNKNVYRFVFPAGEENKNINVVIQAYDFLLKLPVERRSCILAAGGGVVGDLAGFVASTLYRGVDFYNFPTTLLAQVDASIGGKTGVNHSRGKNLIGTYWQPKAVFIDLKTLKTLPERELKAGFAEVIKHALLSSENDWKIIRTHSRESLHSLDFLRWAVEMSVKVKSKIVAKDVREKKKIRYFLNLGHTYAHALESHSLYKKYLHGEAVALGLLFMSAISEVKGELRAGFTLELEKVLKAYGLPTSIIWNQRLKQKILWDKKKEGRNIWVLLKRPGKPFLSYVEDGEIEKAMEVYSCLLSKS